MAPRNLLNLPLEIHLQIFWLLSAPQIARCREVNRIFHLVSSLILMSYLKVCAYFKEAIENSVALQYAIELAICGYKDGPHTDHAPDNTPAARLRKLKRHVDAWNDLQWVESRIVVPDRGPYSLRDGVLVALGSDSVTCVQFPSPIRKLPLRVWTLSNIHAHGLAADPPNDLLVLITL
jgi:hypothetical protein